MEPFFLMENHIFKPKKCEKNISTLHILYARHKFRPNIVLLIVYKKYKLIGDQKQFSFIFRATILSFLV
jgi:hypothetical protein